MSFIDTSSTLQTLELSQSIVRALSLLTVAISNHKTLHSLTCENKKFTADEIDAVAKILESNMSLTALSVRHSGCDDDGGAMIAEALVSNTKLRSLTLQNNSLGVKTAAALRDGIIHPYSSLTTLDLSFNYKDDEIGADYCAVILSETMCRLTSFVFIEYIGATGLTAICNALVKPSARVQTLELAQSLESQTCMMSAMLRTNTSLQRITFYDEFNDEKDAIALGEALTYNKTLTSIDFGAEDLNEQVLMHIDSALHLNNTLLEVETNHFLPDHLRHIELVLEKNQSIQQLKKQLLLYQSEKS